MITREQVLIEVVSGVEGPCLTIGDENGGYRLAGPKPWGGGSTIHSFKVDVSELRHQLEILTQENSV